MKKGVGNLMYIKVSVNRRKPRMLPLPGTYAFNKTELFQVILGSICSKIIN